MENMTRRATIQWWRTMCNAEVMNGIRSAGFSTSTQKVKQFASTTKNAVENQGKSSKMEFKADNIPIYGIFGFVALAMGFAVHTAKQNLLHGPAVQINKGRRTTVVPEVDHPDDVVGHADKFINNSFLRKVGHIQAKDPAHAPDPINPFTRSRDVETLKTVGALPSQKK